MEEYIVKQYLNEIPLNTVMFWYNKLNSELSWSFCGWTGIGKEPYRHWAAYPKLKDSCIQEIWDCINPIFLDEGYNLTVHQIIVNQFNFGDSSWQHKDNNNTNTYTIIVYLNPVWDINWGGWTYVINKTPEAFPPIPGSILFFNSNLEHSAMPVSREAPMPRLGVTFQCVNNV